MPPTVDLDGYWGERTATIDWCEENYVVNYFIAEFWNTVSNVIMIFAPMWTMYLALKEKQEKRYFYNSLVVTVVGIGSWLFHMTLRYSMQLMDELPMIWGSMCLIYSSYMVDSKPKEECKTLQAFMFLYCLVVTLVYVVINIPIFHEVAYALLVFVIVYLGTRVLFKFECNKGLYIVGFITYLLGFILWNIDNVYCHHLKSLRSTPFGQVAGFLYQFHAWWHIFAGMGTYMDLMFVLHARYLYLKRDPQIKYVLGFWPYVSIPKADLDKVK